MKTTLPYPFIFRRLFFVLSLLLLLISFSFAQHFKGKDGAENYTIPGTYILNRYTTLASSENAGSLSITVSNIQDLSGSYSFANAANPYATDTLSTGDLIMIIQMQGADITTTNDANYGAVTNYNNTGNYELRTVYRVAGNAIFLCQGLANSYNQSGRSRTQVVRIPRLTSLATGIGVIITGLDWGGVTGGVVALEAKDSISLYGSISASNIGFRGGIDDKAVSVVSGSGAVTLYRANTPLTTASKGESIAGNSTDYNTLLNGAYGRGAPANGGGGGNGHNAGGGGGSNAGVNGILTPWNGTGIKSTSTAAWANAWNLESAGFATNVSTGAGRGGYTFSNSNQDALLIAPGNAVWGGDRRQNVGGFGGRPLDYNGNTRLFMGGGGGAGEGNNSSSGDGGRGGGIVYLLSSGNISGTGSITANGQDGFNTQASFIDAAGGAGGGGAINISAQGTITSVSLQANGGKGGDQLPLAGEAEGPGGGGGGGFILTTPTSVSRQTTGGANGTSFSAHVTEFTPNGATQGSNGTIAGRIYGDVASCDTNGLILPIKLLSFSAFLQDSKTRLNWAIEGETENNFYQVERSYDGKIFTPIAVVLASNSFTGKGNYSYADDISGLDKQVVYYRLKMVEGNTYSYSGLKIIRIGKQTTTSGMTAYPNPAISDLRITIPADWQGKKIKFEMYDIAGKLTMSLIKSNASQTELINIKDVHAGFYIVRASMGEQATQQMILKK